MLGNVGHFEHIRQPKLGLIIYVYGPRDITHTDKHNDVYLQMSELNNYDINFAKAPTNSFILKKLSSVRYSLSFAY